MMQCYNCGSPLNGNETMCPMCGAQLNQNMNQPMQVGMNGQMTNLTQTNQMMQSPGMSQQPQMMGHNMGMDSMQQYPQGMPMNPNENAYFQQNTNTGGYPNQSNMGFSPMPNQMGQMPIPPTNEPSAASSTEEKPKVSKTMIIIILASAILFIILGIVLAVLSPKEAEEPTPTASPTQTPDIVVPTKANYGGYTFDIPEGYTTSQDETYGLIFNNGTIAYSVKVDYTNNYDSYKQSFIQNYPQQAQSLELAYNDTSYLILQMESSDKQMKTLHYVKSANENTTFVGAIVKKDKTAATMNDLKDLTTILSSGITTEENNTGTEKDSGKDGIINLSTNYYSFIFQEIENGQTIIE